MKKVILGLGSGGGSARVGVEFGAEKSENFFIAFLDVLRYVNV